MKRLSGRLIDRINKLALLGLPQDEIADTLRICQGTVSKYANIRQTKEDKLEADNEEGIRNQSLSA